MATKHEWRVPAPVCKCPTRDIDARSCSVCGVERDIVDDRFGWRASDWRWLPGREPVPPVESSRLACVHCGDPMHAEGVECPAAFKCLDCGEPWTTHGIRCQSRAEGPVNAPHGPWLHDIRVDVDEVLARHAKPTKSEIDFSDDTFQRATPSGYRRTFVPMSRDVLHGGKAHIADERMPGQDSWHQDLTERDLLFEIEEAENVAPSKYQDRLANHNHFVAIRHGLEMPYIKRNAENRVKQDREAARALREAFWERREASK